MHITLGTQCVMVQIGNCDQMLLAVVGTVLKAVLGVISYPCSQWAGFGW